MRAYPFRFLDILDMPRFFRICFVLVGCFILVLSIFYIVASSEKYFGFIDTSNFINLFIFSSLLLWYLFVLKQNTPLIILFAMIALIISFILVFFNCGIELLSVLFLIIYVGAIAILFLFVLMLIDIRRAPNVYFAQNIINFLLIMQQLLFRFSSISLFYLSTFLLELFFLLVRAGLFMSVCVLVVLCFDALFWCTVFVKMHLTVVYLADVLHAFFKCISRDSFVFEVDRNFLFEKKLNSDQNVSLLLLEHSVIFFLFNKQLSNYQFTFAGIINNLLFIYLALFFLCLVATLNIDFLAVLSRNIISVSIAKLSQYTVEVHLIFYLFLAFLTANVFFLGDILQSIFMPSELYFFLQLAPANFLMSDPQDAMYIFNVFFANQFVYIFTIMFVLLTGLLCSVFLCML